MSNPEAVDAAVLSRWKRYTDESADHLELFAPAISELRAIVDELIWWRSYYSQFEARLSRLERLERA